MAYRAYELEDLSAEIEEIKEYIEKTNNSQTEVCLNAKGQG